MIFIYINIYNHFHWIVHITGFCLDAYVKENANDPYTELVLYKRDYWISLYTTKKGEIFFNIVKFI